ncbi:uncharacterized protein BDZ99DRAFT_474249 [Mytilinidion resinicola]|uniref:Uncharacterized protein n=1 Tax=Mytilinidion resinicola TaxID=574789 RepID=A0A6A6YYP2_9PEZI|nr:uncharacterized protein BDZ99DRAFT_474249 [Mytilinidion resinicola]KAF2813619.1 hypothetical protein BDZ99DRAFT_474249 [Mytilinidion resinicola]
MTMLPQEEQAGSTEDIRGSSCNETEYNNDGSQGNEGNGGGIGQTHSIDGLYMNSLTVPGLENPFINRFPNDGNPQTPYVQTVHDKIEAKAKTLALQFDSYQHATENLNLTELSRLAVSRWSKHIAMRTREWKNCTAACVVRRRKKTRCLAFSWMLLRVIEKYILHNMVAELDAMALKNFCTITTFEELVLAFVKYQEIFIILNPDTTDNIYHDVFYMVSEYGTEYQKWAMEQIVYPFDTTDS